MASTGTMQSVASETARLPSSQLFNCSLCPVSFDNNAQHRTHMKSPWHVYNLKRRIASLSPLSLQTFNETVLAADVRSQRECSACQKVFENSKIYQSHLKSRNHLQNLNNTEREASFENRAPATESSLGHLAAISSQIENLDISDTGSNSSEEENEEDTQEELDNVPVFEESNCLFCRQESPDLEQNIAHMSSHGLTIPDRKHLIDVTSFLSYLHVLITQFNECICCGAVRSSIEGVRAHMIDKSHCKVNIKDTEFADFYEFPESNEEDDSKGNRTQIEAQLVQDAEELKLPSGKTLGHRSRAYLYRQHLPSNSPDGQRKALTDSTEGSSSFSAHRDMRMTSRSNMGVVGLSDLEKRSLRVVERKIMRVEMRARNEYRAALEKGGNKQKYFKPDVPGPQNG